MSTIRDIFLIPITSDCVSVGFLSILILSFTTTSRSFEVSVTNAVASSFNIMLSRLSTSPVSTSKRADDGVLYLNVIVCVSVLTISPFKVFTRAEIVYCAPSGTNPVRINLKFRGTEKT